MCVGRSRACPVVPSGQSRLELFPMSGRFHAVPVQREVLTDRTEARQKCLRAAWVTETLHLALTPASGLMTILSAVVHPGRGLHKDVLYAGELRHVRFGCRIAA